jgi:hypothetical protein
MGAHQRVTQLDRLRARQQACQQQGDAEAGETGKGMLSHINKLYQQSGRRSKNPHPRRGFRALE